MQATRGFRVALLLVVLLPLAGGCGYLTESCGSETRDVTASTSESTSAGSDYAQIMLTQNRGTPGSFYWIAQNTTLATSFRGGGLEAVGCSASRG